MAESVLDPEYWQQRMKYAILEHEAVFKLGIEPWERICLKHAEILHEHVGSNVTIVDVGCGWGRILDLIPRRWRGSYLGIDLCPDFVRRAKARHSGKLFWCGKAEEVLARWPECSFDLALLVSVRPMLIRNCGMEYWLRIKEQVDRVATRTLYLEYDPDDEGSFA